MRRLSDDSGAIAVIFALLLSMALFGALAIAIDVGSVYAESRQLQNGAEAAALATARDCANATSACTSAGEMSSTAITDLANANANDGASNVDEICGSGGSLSACAARAAAPAHWDCGAEPTSGNWAQVRTSTRTSSGGTVLPAWFLRALPGVAAGAGTTVRSCARAAWGPAGELYDATIPFTISLCEWMSMTSSGTDLAPSGPYPPWPAEKALYLHTSTQASTCNQGPSGADLPGGFGWTQPADSTCLFTAVVNGWYGDSTGRVPNSNCDSAMSSLVGTVVNIPLYEAVTGTGTTGQYQLAGFAAFYLTGYYVNGSDYRASLVDGVSRCPSGSASDTCIKGFFTHDISAVEGTIGSGTNYGTVVVQLTG